VWGTCARLGTWAHAFAGFIADTLVILLLTGWKGCQLT